MIDFNINDTVRIKLTEYGREILRDNHSRIFIRHKDDERFSYRAPKEDEFGWSEWQLWSVIQEFGPYIVMGGELPFETGIQIVVKK